MITDHFYQQAALSTRLHRHTHRHTHKHRQKDTETHTFGLFNEPTLLVNQDTKALNNEHRMREREIYIYINADAEFNL